MAKKSATKTTKKETPAKPKKVKQAPAAEPLTNFQEIEKTGRKDAGKIIQMPKKESKRHSFDEQPAEETKTKVDQISFRRIGILEQNFLVLSYTKIEKDGTHSEHSGEKYEDRYMHPDLKNKFNLLRIHLGLLAEIISFDQVKSINKYDPDLVEKIRITSVSIKSGEGFTISGGKHRKDNKFIQINPPFERLGQSEETAYRFMDDLTVKVEELCQEALLYLDGSKVGEDPQGKLEFPNPDELPFAEEDL